VRHVFMSPGPIFEIDTDEPDYFRGARAMHAAGFRPGHVVYNTFSYHLTPAGLMMESALRALGCAVVPGGVGNTELQLDAIASIRPDCYVGTPSFLKILIEKAAELGKDISSLKHAFVGAEALPPSLRQMFIDKGMTCLQSYGTADLGTIAYESESIQGMTVDEGVIVEIVRPGTGDPVPEGDVGEVVVTNLDPHHPQIRLALGDLTAALPGASPCGRTNMRIKGWMGRADQTTKVKGMFVRPEQIAEIGTRHPELGRLRLVVTRSGESDLMTLKAETAAPSGNLQDELVATLRSVTKLGGNVELVAERSLPNDGKVIADER
jgi:phenylacetate-CoA ligase